MSAHCHDSTTPRPAPTNPVATGDLRPSVAHAGHALFSTSPRLHSLPMGTSRLVSVTATFVGLFVLGCGSSNGGSDSSAAQPSLESIPAFGKPFAVRDTLLTHPQTWKSADAGSTAILISDTSNLCAQITSGKTTAPGRLAIISLQENGADGSVVDLDPGQFVTQGQGTPSFRYGEVFLSGVDAQCGSSKLFSDQSSIQVTSVGPKSSPVSASIDVHFTSGDTLRGEASRRQSAATRLLSTDI